MADLVLRTETTGIRPAFEYAEQLVRRSQRDPATSGAVHRAVSEPIQRRVFELEWPDADYGEHALLETAWANSENGVRLFDYTPVDDVDANKVEVAFASRPSIVPTGFETYRMAARLEEVL